MSKLSNSRTVKTGRSESAGRAADGVWILRPAAKPTHFTRTQIEKTVDRIKSPRSGNERALVKEQMPRTGSAGADSKKSK